MIRIRRVYNSVLPADRDAVEQAKAIFRSHFGAVAEYAEKFADMLDRPFRYGYLAMMFVAERAGGRLEGFALVLRFPEISSALLDYIAVRGDIRGGGIGSALYEAVREHLSRTGSRGLYLESLPDAPGQMHNDAELKASRQRLRFYEHYGARPIINTAYETPIGSAPAPHLLFDGLGREKPLGRAECQAAMRIILERKYSHLVDAAYINRVVRSVKDDPVQLRPPRYVRPGLEKAEIVDGRMQKSFVLVHSDKHAIHHVKERGYVERPVRAKVLRDVLEATGLFNVVAPRHFGEDPIRAVHDGDFVTYLKAMCEKLESGRPVYPYVFPIRRPERRPKDMAVRAGYYCIDTFTPLDRNAYEAARAAVDVALTAAEEVLHGRSVAYALCRPPGHHAERRTFGGFCYFNNAAIAANMLSRSGKVACVDIDFHHGNGAQDIFWERNDVLTISIHGHPNFSYPYFSGFADEIGAQAGQGFNRNYPLPDGADDALYLAAVEKACERVMRFHPTFLVVSIGFDTMKGDVTGGFTLTVKAMEKIGRLLAGLGLPTLVVQEGGYSLRNLRRGSAAFFRGIAHARHEMPLPRPQ